ncbi:hypothetical protein H0H87_012815, partial [Tephrocybe sp. NHM501043]
MPQLPHTGGYEGDNLCNTVPHGPRIGHLAQVPIIGPSDLLELDDGVPDFAREAVDVHPVVLNVSLGNGEGDDNVEVEADVGVEEPGGVVGGEADGVVTSVVGGECEAPLGSAGGFDEGVICVRLLLGQTQNG